MSFLLIKNTGCSSLINRTAFKTFIKTSSTSGSSPTILKNTPHSINKIKRQTTDWEEKFQYNMRRITDQRKIHRKLGRKHQLQKTLWKGLNLWGDLRSVLLQQIISHSPALYKLKCMIILSDAEKIGKIVFIHCYWKSNQQRISKATYHFPVTLKIAVSPATETMGI